MCCHGRGRVYRIQSRQGLVGARLGRGRTGQFVDWPHGQLISALLAARDQGVKRFVYAASSSVYGDTAVLPKVETMTPNPLSPYAVSKHVGELYCAVLDRKSTRLNSSHVKISYAVF